MTLVDSLRLIGMVAGVGAGVRLGNHFGVIGTIVGGVLGAMLVVAAQVILVLLLWSLTGSSDRHNPSPSGTIVRQYPQHAPGPDALSKSRHVKPIWILPIAAGMFTVVGLIGTVICQDFLMLWCSLLLFLATVVILVAGAFVLGGLLWISTLLAMPASMIIAKLEARIGKANES